MKKTVLFFCFAGIITSNAYAVNFEGITDITPAQENKLVQIQKGYDIENNSLNARITEYTKKIELVKNDTEKTPEQVSLLTGAYERNLDTLKIQQKRLEQITNSQIKTVLNEEQYIQYKNLTEIKD